MSEIPQSQHTTSAAIIRWYESKPQEHRPHMGASLIGHNCDRFIWLTWRWALKPEFKGRMLRLFNTGQRAESRFVEELRAIGADVWDVDPDSGDQWRVSACNGHFGGSLDGVAKGLPEAPKSPAVLEMKTHNQKSFDELVKKTVKNAKPQHYSQMQVYMGLMEIPRALYIAENKNDSAVYTEWVHFDDEVFGNLIDRAQRLIESPVPPYRISTDKDFFECKWCSMWKHCHGGQAAEDNCRTCTHSSAVEAGAWHCDKHNKVLDYKAQTQGCDNHLLIPDLIPFADAQDGGENWVAYKHKESGDHFINGPESLAEYGPNFSSRELHATNGSLIPDVIKLKLEFPVSKVATGSTTAEHQNMETMWDDLATHPDDIQVKADAPTKREQAKKIKGAVKAMEGLRK
jgi:hypothetical protein